MNEAKFTKYINEFNELRESIKEAKRQKAQSEVIELSNSAIELSKRCPDLEIVVECALRVGQISSKN